MTITTNEEQIQDRLRAAEAEMNRWQAVATHGREPSEEEEAQLREHARQNPGAGDGSSAAWSLFYEAQDQAITLRRALETTERERRRGRSQAAAERGPDRVRERAAADLDEARAAIARLEARHAEVCFQAVGVENPNIQVIEDVEAALNGLRVQERRAEAAIEEATRRLENQ
jgi:hypothetical protein